MKTFLLLFVVSLSCNGMSVKNPDQTAPKKEAVKKAETKPVHPALKKEEDCDDKAKKPIEIKPETISLGGGNTGCSLPE